MKKLLFAILMLTASSGFSQIKISALPSKSDTTGFDDVLIPLVDGSTTKKMTGSTLKQGIQRTTYVADPLYKQGDTIKIHDSAYVEQTSPHDATYKAGHDTSVIIPTSTPSTLTKFSGFRETSTNYKMIKGIGVSALGLQHNSLIDFVGNSSVGYSYGLRKYDSYSNIIYSGGTTSSFVQTPTGTQLAFGANSLTINTSGIGINGLYLPTSIPSGAGEIIMSTSTTASAWVVPDYISQATLDDSTAVLRALIEAMGGGSSDLNTVTSVDSNTTHSMTVSTNNMAWIKAENPSTSGFAGVYANTVNGGYLALANTSGGTVHLRSYSSGGGLYTQFLQSRGGTVALNPSLPTDSVNDPWNMVWYNSVTNRFMVADVPTGGGMAGVESVTGTSVDNTDPQNPVITAYSPAQLDSVLSERFSYGEYGPTVSNQVNLDEVEFADSGGGPIISYSKNLDVVTVYGSVYIDPTTSGSWSFTIDLPFAATSLGNWHVGGTGCPGLGGEYSCFKVIAYTVTNNAVQFIGNASSTPQDYSFSFTYRIAN